MYLAVLRLWNFRKFGSKNELVFGKKLRTPDLEVKFIQGLNVLIGENDTGKSTIIDAIKLILKTHSFDWIRLDDEDFYRETKNLRIECRFNDLSAQEAKNFTEWLGFEGEGENAQVYLKIILEAKRNEERIFPFDIRAGADDEGYVLPAEAKEYLKATYLKPLRDAKTELIPKKNSRLSQILQGHEIFRGRDKDHELVKVFNEFSQKIEGYFKSDEKDGYKLKGTLEELLKGFFGEEKKAEFDITEQKLKNILEILYLTLEDGKLGLGSHNLLFIAAELLNLKKTNWDGLKLCLVEELEAHLHPQAQLRVIKSLQQEKHIQFILTTHSPNLASTIEFNRLLICAEDSEKKANVFPMGEQYTQLDKDNYRFLERFLDVTRSNLFFAKGVILVEGWSEEILLPIIAKKIGIDLTEKGIALINVAGKAFLHYAKIFQRKENPWMNIPVAVVIDIDIKPNDENKSACAQKTTAIEEEYNKQKVKIFISPHWTLEWCLWSSFSLKDKFEEVVKSVHPKTDFSEGFDAQLKTMLEKKTLKKTEVAYRLAKVIEDDQFATIAKMDENIKYLMDAIKYAASQD